jgi:hypothetical protein
MLELLGIINMNSWTHFADFPKPEFSWIIQITFTICFELFHFQQIQFDHFFWLFFAIYNPVIYNYKTVSKTEITIHCLEFSCLPLICWFLANFSSFFSRLTPDSVHAFLSTDAVMSTAQ